MQTLPEFSLKLKTPGVTVQSWKARVSMRSCKIVYTSHWLAAEPILLFTRHELAAAWQDTTTVCRYGDPPGMEINSPALHIFAILKRCFLHCNGHIWQVDGKHGGCAHDPSCMVSQDVIPPFREEGQYRSVTHPPAKYQHISYLVITFIHVYNIYVYI